jgi:hypothetical protein
VSAIALAVACGCAKNAATSVSGQRDIVVQQQGRAASCVVDGMKGPPSYLVRDAGKSVVPPLTASQRTMLRKIMAYVHPSTLRFAFVGGEFIVFDAQNGPCETGAPGYSVLNSVSCNEMYSPTDNFDHTRAVPECWNAPRPWIPHDVGQGKTPWTKYDNAH